MDNTSFSFLENVSCSADEKILEKYSIYESKLGNVGNSIVAIYLFCIGIFGLPLNIMVVRVQIKFWKKLSPVEVAILCLTVNNLLFTLLLPMPIHSAYNQKWVFGKIGSNMYGFLGSCATLANIYNLVIISFWRYLSTCWPDKKRFVTRRNMMLSLLGAYVFSVVWSTLPFLGWGHFGMEYTGLHSALDWKNSLSYVVTLVILGLILPGSLMIVCYYKIWLKIRQDSTFNPRAFNLAKLSVLMCVGFFVAWLPYGLLGLCSAFISEADIPLVLLTCPSMLCKSSVLYNPLLYYLCIRTFRFRLRACFRTNAVSDVQNCDQTQSPQES